MSSSAADEEDIEVLRRAALKSMNRFKDNMSVSESSGRSQQNNRTNNAIKANNIHKLYYNNSHRNGSKRSNLIILTKSDKELSKSQTDSHSNCFTKIVDKRSEVQEKGKRVLPGRFSRLERDDNSDEDTDEFSDDYSDHQMSANRAFSHKSDEQPLVVSDSPNILSEDSVSDKIDLSKGNDHLNDSTNGSIIDKNNSLVTNCTLIEETTLNHKESNDSERKDLIKLNSNNISKSEAIERRKQKFGQTSAQERYNSSVDSSNSNSRDQKLNIKNRISIKPNHRQKNSNERNYKKSLSDKEMVSHNRHNINSRDNNMETMEDSDEYHSSKKKLRSLVVLK